MLESKVAEHARAAQRWWFHLYTVVMAATKVAEEGEEDEEAPEEEGFELDDIFQSLAEFMQKATLADFGLRLRMLQHAGVREHEKSNGRCFTPPETLVLLGFRVFGFPAAGVILYGGGFQPGCWHATSAGSGWCF